MNHSDRETRSQGSPSTTAPGIALVVVLALVGSVGWWLYLRPVRELDPVAIHQVSNSIAGWAGEDIPISEGVERMLRADAHVQRVYRSPDHELLWLYVGYYGTDRGGRPEHTPWVCYPSAGWAILSSVEGPLGDDGGPIDEGRMNEFVVELNGERRLVYFWYMTHRTTAIATETALTVDHVQGRFSVSGRADGALVRVSTPIAEGGIEVSRERLNRFARPLVAELRINWPEA